MATTVAHASLIRYDDDGNQLVINLKNTGDDVSITGSANSNLPAGATTVQGLANSLGALAFKNSLSKADVGLGNVNNTADANKSVNYASTAGATTKVTRIKHLSTTEELDGFVEANTFQYATVDSVAPIKNDGIILSMTWKDSPNYAHQIYINDDDPLMMQRGRHAGTWSDWVKMIDSSNIGSQSVNYANTAGSSNSASSATKATHVVDCGNVNDTIEIGYGGSGISGDAIRFIAGYTYGGNGNVARIKDVSKSALISWMGVLPGDSIFYVSKEAPSGPCIWAKID